VTVMRSFLPSCCLAFLCWIATTTTNAQSPDLNTTFNDCDNLTLGNFLFILVSASDPFDELSIFAFENLPPGLELYLTDNAWNGQRFLTNEGVLKLTTPADGGIPAGTTFGYGPNAPTGAYLYGTDWTIDQGNFALSNTEGEQVFLFCFSSTNQPRPLAAISYNGNFSSPGRADSYYGFNRSAVPPELEENNAVIVLPFATRWSYVGPKSLQTDELKAAIVDTQANWASSGRAKPTTNAAMFISSVSIWLAFQLWAWV